MAIRTKINPLGALGTKYYTLTIVTSPSNATCVLTVNSIEYTTKSLKVKEGTVVSYSISYSGTTTKNGSVTMNSNKTLTFTRTSQSTPSTTNVSWLQPTLSANGTLGSGDFAVNASQYNSSYQAHDAFDGSTSTSWVPQPHQTPASSVDVTKLYMTMYFGKAVNISKFNFRNRAASNTAPVSWQLYRSSNGSSWTLASSGSNSVQTASGTCTANISHSGNYNYFQMRFGSDWKYTSQSGRGINEWTITATYKNTIYTTTYYFTVTTT